MSVAALLGVTASGKSEVALELARRRGDVEIVSVDSMCVYRGMDLATSKPSAADRAAVPHHLVDLVEPSEAFTVMQFQQAAGQVLDEIAAHGRHALLVGGTGLYLRAVVDGLRFPGRYPEAAHELERSLEDGCASVGDLHARLAQLDPTAASRIEPTNRRRVVRALEVVMGSGRPFSSFGPGLSVYPKTAVTMVGIVMGHDEVDARITARLWRWVDEGLVDEVRGLLTRPGGLSRSARQALGYREVLEHLEGGRPLTECVAEAVGRTKAFARRQSAWFRRDPRIVWTDPAPGAAALIDAALGRAGERVGLRD